MATQFHLKVNRDIIAPNTTDYAIQSKAEEMAINPDTLEKVAKVKNAIISRILDEISVFLLTDEAQTTYSPDGRIDVKKFDSRTLFLTSISDTLNEKLQKLYPQAYIEQESFFTWGLSRITSILS